MIHHYIRQLISVFLTTMVSATLLAQQKDVNYEKDVAPLLQKYCAGCHNDNDPEAEFSVQTFAGLLRGGSSGQAVVSGDSAKSPLVQRMMGQLEPIMPPEGEPRPTDKENALIAAWIDAGAVGPETATRTAAEFPNLAAAKNLTPAVTAVDWSSQDVIAVGRFRTVELLDKSKKLLRTLDDFPGKVNSLRFSPDGKRLTVASGIAGLSGQASVWNVKTGKPLHKIEGHNDTIYMALESPNGYLLAMAGYDRRITVWDLITGKQLHELTGHNDAIYDLDFSRDSQHLISASGDQTIKIWNLATGQRLDTLGQPLEEQFAARFSPDNRLIVAGGRDNRIRVWQFVSRGAVKTNPLLVARFAHEAPIVQLKFSPDGSKLISSSEDRTIKLWDAARFRQIGTIKDQSDVCAALAPSPDGSQIFIGRLDGSTELVKLPEIQSPPDVRGVEGDHDVISFSPIEPERRLETEPNDVPQRANPIRVPTIVSGHIHREDGVDADLFCFSAQSGQPLILEIKAARNKSPLDSKIEILDLEGVPVPRVLLPAVRDSYFTFRGKDSNTSNDFRLHNWQEMELNDYLYAGGEVVKLFLHPRGPDSGFKVYPGSGARYGFFDTTPTAHALHEPCYIVRPYPVGTVLPANGLPVFQLNYENDDESFRKLGRDSRLNFIPPADAQYIVKVNDVRGFDGPEFAYELHVRPSRPDFEVKLAHKKDLHKASGQEFSVTADRIDGFDGEITVEIENIPESLNITTPLHIEANHNVALGTIHLKSGYDLPSTEEVKGITLRAVATIGGEKIKKQVNGFGEIKFHESPKVQIRIVKPDDDRNGLFDSEPEQPIVFELEAGQKVEATVVANRIEHEQRISFGNEDSGRNLPHGVYVDDIGLNGLMIVKGKSQRRFFITAEHWVRPTTRSFHVRANDVGGQASWPVMIRVVAPKNAGNGPTTND